MSSIFKSLFKKTASPSFFLVLIVSLGSYLRFNNIEKLGTYGSDSVLYWSLAQQAAQSEHQPITYQVGCGKEAYRPVAFFIYSTAIQIFGDTDSAIKKINSLMDILSLILLFFLSQLILKSSWLALLPCLIFALLPSNIHWARSELVHTLSGFFTLLGLLCYLLTSYSFKSFKTYTFGALAGVSLTLMVTLHEDLTAILVGLFLYHCITLYNFKNHLTQKQHFKQHLSHGIVIFITSLLTLCAFDIKKLFFKHSKRTSAEFVQQNNIFDFLPDVFYSFTGVNISPLFFYFYLFSFALLIYLAFSQKKNWKSNSTLQSYLFLPLILLTYIALYSLFVGRLYPRLFSPLVSLAVLQTLSLFYFSFRQWFNPATLNSFIVALGLTIITSAYLYPTSTPVLIESNRSKNRSLGLKTLPKPYKKILSGKTPKPTNARRIYDRLSHLVAPNQKLLATPSTIYSWSGRRILNNYFHDQVIYSIDQEYDLSETVKNKNIRFIVHFTDAHRWDQRFKSVNWQCQYQGNQTWEKREPFYIGQYYSWKPGEYSEQKERIKINQLIAARKGVEIDRKPNPNGYIIWDLSPSDQE